MRITGTLTAPRWAGDYLNRDSLLPGGARLDAAAFAADADGRKNVPSGTIVGRTYAERDAGGGFGPVAFTAGTAVTDEEVYIVAFDVTDAAKNPDVELYRPHRVVKENFLPGWDALDSAVQDEIRARYTCTLGAE